MKEISKRKPGVKFHRQVPVHEYILDFYCHELKLAIEVDGGSHDVPAQREKDKIRDFKLQQLGIIVLRIDDLDVKRNLDSVVRFLRFRIKQILCGRE
ncbi:MAG: endonuclease domain-containing protein [Balneola sp.]